jgi:hypothetical protein
MWWGMTKGLGWFAEMKEAVLCSLLGIGLVRRSRGGLVLLLR